jgi:hypothetical protein
MTMRTYEEVFGTAKREWSRAKSANLMSSRRPGCRSPGYLIDGGPGVNDEAGAVRAGPVADHGDASHSSRAPSGWRRTSPSPIVSHGNDFRCPRRAGCAASDDRQERGRRRVNRAGQGAGVEGQNFGYNVQADVYENLVTSGVIDPTKVTRTALQNTVSIAGLLVTTECVMAERKEDKPAPRVGLRGVAWWNVLTPPV